MRDDLKERLRAMVTNRPDSLGICTSWHRNPDGPEAADRIATLEAKLAEKDAQLAEALRAENARLQARADAARREALEEAAKVARDYASKAAQRGWVLKPGSIVTAARHIATTIRALKEQANAAT